MAASSRARFLHPADLNATLCRNDCTPDCIYFRFCTPPPLPPLWSPPINITIDPPDPPSPPAAPTTIHLNHHSLSLLPRLLIAGGSLLAASLLLFLTLFALLRLRRRRRRRAQGVQNLDIHVTNIDDGDDFFGGGEADHHVWYIRTVGLDERTIRGIAALTYKAGDGLLGGASDCPVCLAEFRDGEHIRLLPKCGHAFHLTCIDTWLRSHVNCPLCRAPVMAPVAALEAAEAANAAASDSASSASSSSASAPDPGDPPSGASALVETTQIVISPLETDQVDQEMESESDQEIEIGHGFEIVVDPRSAASSSHPSTSELGVSNELGEDVLQPIRRSVSMDSSSLAALLSRDDSEEKSSAERKEPDFEEERVNNSGDKQENASKEVSPHKGPLDMERSLSSSGVRFFLSRQGRARRAVLPL